MKKLAILSTVFLFSVTMVFGQTEKKVKEEIKETKRELKTEKEALRKLEGTDVSVLSKDNFYADFGDVPDVIWKKDGLYDVAEFTKDGKILKAFYDFDSNLVGTTHYVTFAEVPESGQQEIKKEYEDYEIGPVVFFDDNEVNETDMLLYGMQFADEDNYFVELTKGTEKIVLQVNGHGEVFFFKEL